MTKYTILVTRTSFAYQEFAVEASDEESAIVAAEQQASDITWGTGNVEYESEVTSKVTCYKVEDIEFDFSNSFDEIISKEYQDGLIEKTLNKTWKIYDDTDLVDLISDEIGWCILSIRYSETTSDK